MAGRGWCDTRVQGLESGGQKGSRVVGKLVQVWKAPLQDVACEHFVSGVPSTTVGQPSLWKLQKCNRKKRVRGDSAPYGSCRSAIEMAEGVNEQDFYPESSRSLDSLRHMRLMALLRDMTEAEGKVKAAKALGVNYRNHVEGGQVRHADRPDGVGGAGGRFGAGTAAVGAAGLNPGAVVEVGADGGSGAGFSRVLHRSYVRANSELTRRK